jgi:hypothetical protein
MNIYTDPLCSALGVRPITDFFPDYDFNDISSSFEAYNNVSGHLNPFYGLTHTEETKDRLKEAWAKNSQRKQDLAEMAKDPKVCKKRAHSIKEWYNNASEKEIYKKTKDGLKAMNSYIECPHCGIKTNKGNISRYHGNKCKKKVDNNATLE